MIVGEKEFDVNRLWKTITISDQCNDYINMHLEMLALNLDLQANPKPMVFKYADVFPYCTCDIILPEDSVNYVYFLVSVQDFDKNYVVQTENLAQLSHQHNKDNNAKENNYPYYRPYCIAAYICGLSHMEQYRRECLEDL